MHGRTGVREASKRRAGGLAGFIAEHEACPGELELDREGGAIVVGCALCGRSFTQPGPEGHYDTRRVERALASLTERPGAEPSQAKPPRLPPPGPLGFRRRRSAPARLRAGAGSLLMALPEAVSRRKAALLATGLALATASALFVVVGSDEQVQPPDAQALGGSELPIEASPDAAGAASAPRDLAPAGSRDARRARVERRAWLQGREAPTGAASNSATSAR